MDIDIFRTAGLSDEEASVYGVLLERGALSASGLAEAVGSIRRTTVYKVVERLIEMRLVERVARDGVALFAPRSPEILREQLLAQQDALEKYRKHLEEALPDLQSKFHLTKERPVVAFKEGIEGLREIYEDHISTGKPLRFMRSNVASHYMKHFGKWWEHYLTRRQKRGIRSMAITPDDAEANHDVALDAARKLSRTWIRPQDYTAPVEIDIYGDKVAIISFGKEVFGIVIQDEQVANAFTDMFTLAEKGGATIEVKHDHK